MTRRGGASVRVVLGGLLILLHGCKNPLEGAADRIGRERQEARDAELQNQVQAEVKADAKRMGNDLRPLLEIQNRANALFNETGREPAREPGKVKDGGGEAKPAE